MLFANVCLSSLVHFGSGYQIDTGVEAKSGYLKRERGSKRTGGRLRLGLQILQAASKLDQAPHCRQCHLVSGRGSWQQCRSSSSHCLWQHVSLHCSAVHLHVHFWLLLHSNPPRSDQCSLVQLQVCAAERINHLVATLRSPESPTFKPTITARTR